MPPITSFIRLNSKKVIPLRIFVNIRARANPGEILQQASGNTTAKRSVEDNLDDVKGEREREGEGDEIDKEQFAIPSIENLQRKAIIRLNNKNVKSGIRLNNRDLNQLSLDIRRQLIQYLLETSEVELEKITGENMSNDSNVKELIEMFPNFNKKLIFVLDHSIYNLHLIVSLSDVIKIRQSMTMGYYTHDNNTVGVPYHNLLLTDMVMDKPKKKKIDNDNDDTLFMDGEEVDEKVSVKYKYHKQKVIRAKIDLHILSRK